jgi:hypothetical protein
MERTVIYQIAPEDLHYFLAQEAQKYRKNEVDEFLKRFENSTLGVSEVAALHNVSPATVRNYIDDGLITPEIRTVENGKYRFRGDYALKLDFYKLKKQLKEKTA